MEFPPGKAYAKGLKAVGYHDLNGKPGFKMAIHKKGDRWYLYSPGLWDSGFHILDITDPTNPKHIRWIAGHPEYLDLAGADRRGAHDHLGRAHLARLGRYAGRAL